MKQIITISAIALFIAVSCNNSSNTSLETGDTLTIDSIAATSPSSQIWIVDRNASNILWKGTKPTAEHIGTINIKEGNLSSENNKITGGRFVIDMTTIMETSHANDPKSQNKLVSHLKSNDFFNVDSFPLSTFVLTKIERDSVFGNLTIKAITRSIKFPVNITIEGAKLTAITGFDINRTDWEINYNSGKKLKDKLANTIISNTISYKITLVAYKQ